MKVKEPHRQSESGMSGNEQVRVEIETFLRALNSYPALFAANPRVTFEEYRTSLMPPGRTSPGSRQLGNSLER
ncbi:MAG TPA: hypothetical protein VKQ11_03775 [Candidatus Sulfotelmatobacter sp.]|nr:hypothetical protein [Candidatus Sulfotelmatobacter sp.]